MISPKRAWKWKEIKRKEGGGFLAPNASICFRFGFGARFGCRLCKDKNDSLSLSFFYNSLQENPFPPWPPPLSENKIIFFFSKNSQLSHNTHTHTLSLCFSGFALFLSVFKHILEQNFQDSKQSTLYFQDGDRKSRNHCSGNQAQE